MPDNTYTAKTRLLAPVPRSKRMRDANVTVAQQSSSSQQVEKTWNRDTESVQDVEVLVPVAEPLVEVLRLRNGSHIVTINVDSNGYLHVDAGLYSDSFVSALGSGSGSGTGGGGGGIDITDLLNILNGTTDISEYTVSKTIATSFLGNAITALTKQMVEAVLTGNITTHTHSQYLTEITKSMVEAVMTGNITSHTHSTLAMAHSNEINFTNSAGQYRFWFNYRDGDTDALNPNNLLTEYSFGNRNGVANARLNAGSMMLTSGAEVGGDILPTTAFTCNLGAYSQSWNRIITRYIDTASAYDLRVCTYGTERLHINASDGHIGIGTASPTEFLHLYKPSAAQSVVLFQNSNANVICGIEPGGNGVLWNRNNNYIRFGTNATERMRILANGSIAIGQTEATTVLDVYGTIRSRAFNANGRSHAAFIWDKAGSNYTGVGSNNETDTIYFGACDVTGTWVSYSQLWKFGGSIYATGAVTALATSASDRRLKKDIKPFSAREIIDKLQPVEFRWNDEATEFNGFLPRKHLQHGLIAQDSDGIIDGFVFDLGKGTDYKGIHYEKLTPILLQAVKEQQAEIDSLKAEVAELKKIVKRLIEK